MAGIAHFSKFFLWMEQAEHDFLESLGLSVVVDRDGERFGLPRVNASCDYLSPARYRDVLSIAVSVEEAGRSSIRYGFRFSLGDRPVAKGVITVCFCAMTPQGISARPIPDWFRQRLGVGA
jgi:YbgC/YbaW family acyl-CoA thioester hydrolase